MAEPSACAWSSSHALAVEGKVRIGAEVHQHVRVAGLVIRDDQPTSLVSCELEGTQGGQTID